MTRWTFISLYCFLLLSTGATQLLSTEKVGPVEISIIPKPTYYKVHPGIFNLVRDTNIFVDQDSRIQAIADYTIDFLSSATGYPLSKEAGAMTEKKSVILLHLLNKPQLGEEGYEIEVTPEFVLLQAFRPNGLFHAVQSLRQLLPPEIETREATPGVWAIPCSKLQDLPRFRWRGLLLDCGRHYMTADFIKRYIDLLALYKMNVFHWHLTEDQGWRIEIKKYPRLTEIGAWRTYEDGAVYGGYYTQEQIRDIVAYAQKRYVQIVPEIEMPGHSLAALSAYPEFSCTGGPFKVETQNGVFQDIYCAGNDSTFTFLQDILDEVIALFPSSYIHIGGDEVQKSRWQHCHKCQTRIKREGLKDEVELQSYFIKRIEKYLIDKNKKIIGWDEILEGGLAPEATVQSWRGMDRAAEAARLGHDAIVSPTSHAYFDAPLQSIDLRTVFTFNPLPKGLSVIEQERIIGGECNMWTEHAPQPVVDSKIFPRLLAMAERLWSTADNDDFNAFVYRIRQHYQRLDYLGVKYGAESHPVVILPRFDAKEKYYRVQLLTGEKGLQVRYTLDGAEPTIHSIVYNKPFTIYNTVTVKACTFREDLAYGETAEKSFKLHLAVGKKIDISKKYGPKYPAGGGTALIDGMNGSAAFRDGYWQGYEQDDLKAVIDLGKVMPIQAIDTGFLQDANSWIFLPISVRYDVSQDGKTFVTVVEQTHNIPQKTQDAVIKRFREVLLDTQARYIRVDAENIGTCPPWHPGAGGKAWIFADEIIIE